MFWRRRIPMHSDERGYEPTSSERQDEMTVEEEVTESYDPMRAGTGVLRGLVGVGLLIVGVIIGFRFFFLLAGANAGNNFVDFIYDTSRPLVAPFDGIVGDRTAADGVLEPESIIALIVYAVMAWIAVALIGVAERGIVPHVQSSSHGVRRYDHRRRAH